jgi:hypothetical protein
MSHLKDIVFIIAICALIGSCTYSISQSEKLRFCVQAGKEFINGDCVTRQP